MRRLTVNVDANVVAQAKRYAARQGTTISRLVEAYLALLGSSAAVVQDLPPVTRRLAGVLRGSRYGRQEHRRHLERRYR